MNDIFFIIGLQRETLTVAFICAMCCTLVLSVFTTPLGKVSYLFNFLALFAGAAAASGALHKLGWTMEGELERQLLASFGGMALVAIVIILKWPRSRIGL
ncbi:MAG: hypothetical protein IOC86_13745 [Aestuariivirga sp.]|nr:hypothetical protein [Aestuariivirga sp.]